MVNHKRAPRKRRQQIVAIPFEGGVALGTLADNTVILTGALTSALAENFRCTSVKAFWAVKQQTIGEGPLYFGYAHNDYTVAEVDENLEVDYSDPADKIAMERSRRLVRKVGQFPSIAVDEVWDGGRPIKTRLNWVLNEGSNLSLFLKNKSSGALTTGTVLTVQGTLYGYWMY